MAILNNLIVHGSSRFLNGINANSIHTDLIDANDGVFKTITTTTLDANTITTDMLKANNARVSQTLAVDGTISTNKWEAASIANIGGNFYISPTGKADSGTITVTKTSTTTVNGVSVGVYTIVVSGTFGVTSTSSTIWGTSSKVIFTGSISYPKMTGTDLTTTGKKYPLGSCNGTMTQVSTGTGTLTGFTITGVNSPALDIFFQEVGVTSVSSTACSGYEMQISVYQSYYSSALHPVGILLTSYGKEKKQYIDIYGGANTLGDSDSGFADPAVRIGQLDGLPNIVDGSTAEATTPTGWGIYTNNGFFKGKIVSNAGIIANFTINGSKLYSNGHSAYNTATTGIYIGDDYISFGSGGVTYFNTSGTGKVGPWTLTTTALYNTKSSYNNSNAGVYIGTDYIAGGAGEKWWLKSDGSAKIGAMTLSSAGVLAVPAANVTGTLTASQVDVSGIITSGGIVTNTLTGGTFNTTDYIRVSTQASSSLTIGTSGAKTDWRIIAGKTFGVDKSGNLYATSANITGTVNATSFSAKYYDSNNILQRQIALDAFGLKIMDGTSPTPNILSQFGTTSTIGRDSGDNYNINITGTDIDLRYNANVLNRINNNGMVLYDGSGVADSNILAKFNTNGAQIGKSNKTHANVYSNSLELTDSSNTTFFKVRDAVNESGQVTDTFAGNGEKTEFSLSYTASNTDYTVTQNDVTVSPTKTTTKITFSTAPAVGDIIVVVYNVVGNSAKAYDLGIRKTNIISGNYSVIEGYETAASGSYSHAEGRQSIARGGCSHAEGDNVQANGTISHAEGIKTYAIGNYSHAEGQLSVASGKCSHAEGNNTTANRDNSHAEGNSTIASGDNSHAEGFYTHATQECAHAEGTHTYASGVYSHAEGDHSEARGNMSHAQNSGTTAQTQSQTAIGEYNKPDPNSGSFLSPAQRGQYVLIIGNGTSELSRSNALTVDWDGNVEAAGDYITRQTTLNLGNYVGAAILSSNAGDLQFSIPTGRVFPTGTTISKITFNIVARSSNANGVGYYIIKSASGGSDGAAFDSSASKTFYNANNASKTITTSMWRKYLDGGTNIRIMFVGGNDFFSGTTTIRNYINNNAATVYVYNIVVTLDIPST